MQLVIVESPAKAKTIEKYLGPGFKVLASYGHVRDLPPKDGSVRPDDGFAMDWDLYGDKAKQVKAITDAAKQADGLILATDPDREGEAISWHVRELLAKRKALPKDVSRVTFNAITKQAVTQAMKAPRDLDQDLIDAYLARRALDYLFGFTLSPVLWRKLPGAKSAGRVQSVALRLIVEREREIELFKPQEYWSVVAQMEHDGTAFEARLVKFEGDKLERLSLGEQGVAMRAKAAASQPAVHDIDLAAGSRAQARLFRQPDHAGGAEALRGGRDHLHADRRRADGPFGHFGCAGRHFQSLRRAFPARKAAPLQHQGQERAGSARGDPSHRFRSGPLRRRR
jgi:DNA topoisomerase-1